MKAFPIFDSPEILRPQLGEFSFYWRLVPQTSKNLDSTTPCKRRKTWILHLASVEKLGFYTIQA